MSAARLRIDPWVDVDGALGITPGEKPDVESLPLNETLPVPDELPSNVPIDGHGLVVEEIPRHVEYPRPARAVALGVPVDIEAHRAAFQRKSYPGVVEKKAEKITPPPLVPKRTATAEEIPDAAARAAALIEARGLPVWTTFAQGGEWRRWRDRGECATCGATPMMLAEDKRDLESGAVLQPHNRPRGRCPSRSTTFHAGLVVCAGCGWRPRRLNKDGTVPPHDVPLVPCPDQASSRVIPGEPRPPVTSIAVRALPHVGVAVWMTEPGAGGKVEGKFDLAYVVRGTLLVKASAAEFTAACRGEAS